MTPEERLKEDIKKLILIRLRRKISIKTLNVLVDNYYRSMILWGRYEEVLY